MKESVLVLSLVFFFLIPSTASSQFDLGKTIEKKVTKKAKKETEKAVDKAIDETEKGIKGEGDEEGNSKGTATKTGAAGDLKPWSKYDFVPGDKIIFEDDLAGELNGEFPSRWDLASGNVENASFDGMNVISFGSRSEIMPLMSKPDYLPEVFTIEFDVYFYLKGNEAYTLKFRPKHSIDIRRYAVTMGKFKGSPESAIAQPGWHHIAVSFNKRAFKLYYDQDRVLNIPNLQEKLTSFSISALVHSTAKGFAPMIKNIRVAEGGVKLYDRVKTDGKFITRGILFESGKASVRPESMGVLNEIAAMMKGHPDLKFRIEGHTDSDGDEAFNQDLSEKRSAAVKAELANLNIDESRFEIRGWGESKPVDSNNSPEAKANNRRVEFIKI